MPAVPTIEALKKVFPAEQLYVRGTDEFDKTNGSYLSALENDITPAAIVLAKTTKDVSNFLITIKPFIASGETAFAIRGAGQQPLPGCANVQDGVTLDLRMLTGVELDLDSGIVSIAAGERWGAVYEKLHDHGLGVTGSRSAKGGTGGLALAGGLSFFSTREGLICDNVVSHDIVLASGEFVRCSADSNVELWKALRSGRNNFGIVTHYHMRTFKQGPFWGGSLFYFPASFPGQIDALVQQLSKRPCLPMNRVAYVNTTVKADAATLKTAAESFTSSLALVKNFEGVVFSLTLQPYPVSLLEKCISAGGNVAGLTPTSGPLVSVLKIHAVAKSLIENTDDDTAASGQAVAYKYMNYAFSFQDPISSYGAENKKFLQEVGKKYDSEGIFQKGFPGAFKLFV
ncbi:FAD-binding domain-containing protein [Biscogniauxia marginata]|nr:FAD-binding domain-containing protein [Biscogniauxia marginata]